MGYQGSQLSAAVSVRAWLCTGRCRSGAVLCCPFSHSNQSTNPAPPSSHLGQSFPSSGSFVCCQRWHLDYHDLLLFFFLERGLASHRKVLEWCRACGADRASPNRASIVGVRSSSSSLHASSLLDHPVRVLSTMGMIHLCIVHIFATERRYN